MKKENQSEQRIEQGKKSLNEMLDRLGPFLPKCDLSVPKPADDWRLSEKARESKVERVALSCTYPF